MERDGKRDREEKPKVNRATGPTLLEDLMGRPGLLLEETQVQNRGG